MSSEEGLGEKIKMAVKEPYKQVIKLVYKVSIEGKLISLITDFI